MNKNGIEVMIYMTMIASMLLLIYKKETIWDTKPPKDVLQWKLG